MKKKLAEIGKVFRLPGDIIDFEVIKNGNINTTYQVKYRLPDKNYKSYIFQKINTFVFKKPVEIMENIDNVTTYIRNNSKDKVTLHFYHTNDGNNYYFDKEGNFWRIMNYIESITFNSCDNLDIIEATGAAFGEFQVQLSNFDGSILHETIPDFHNTKKRLDTLLAHVEEDPCGRVESVKEEIEYIKSVYDKASLLSVKFKNGELPIRVTHNDTKANNVLFDKTTLKPLVVIDLDTVMPGMAMYDFADAIRFIGNTAEEDEPDLGKVSFDINKFTAFSKGFIGKVCDSLNKEEIESLVLATFSITVELAARFLDDYITGDKYFKTLYPEHNIVRTRCQLHLAKDIANKRDILNEIILSVYNCI